MAPTIRGYICVPATISVHLSVQAAICMYVCMCTGNHLRFCMCIGRSDAVNVNRMTKPQPSYQQFTTILPYSSWHSGEGQ